MNDREDRGAQEGQRHFERLADDRNRWHGRKTRVEFTSSEVLGRFPRTSASPFVKWEWNYFTGLLWGLEIIKWMYLSHRRQLVNGNSPDSDDLWQGQISSVLATSCPRTFPLKVLFTPGWGKVSFSRQLLIWFIEWQLLYPIASERVLRKILLRKGSFFSPNAFLHDKEREILVGYSLHEQISS